MRDPLTSTHTSRVSSALTARASASVSANHSRQLAGGEQPVDAVVARKPADVAMTFVGKTTEFPHVAHDQPAPRIHVRQHLDPGLHRTRVRVVRVVYDPGTARRGFELQSARNRAHCGEPGANVVERRARGSRRRRGAQGIQHVVAARQVHLDRHRACGRPQLESRHEAGDVDRRVYFACREIRRCSDTKSRHTAARHAEPQRSEPVVGIDDGGRRALEPGHHFTFRARHPLEAAETLEVFGSRVGDESHGGPRQLEQVCDFAGAVGADFNDRIAV
jgi:hypothetical protein